MNFKSLGLEIRDFLEWLQEKEDKLKIPVNVRSNEVITYPCAIRPKQF